MSIHLYHKTSEQMSRRLALNYSTSFGIGIRLLAKEYRAPIFSIYGLVRIADEIVDTFHNHNQARLLEEFKEQTYKAIEDGISTNPVLHAFQLTANQYRIGKELLQPFFDSMQTDLQKNAHDSASYANYIYGSAETVGLMCLRVFCSGNEELYKKLIPYACSLGAAFQKVNFLRDMKSDISDLGRVYFPGVNFSNFSDEDKLRIVDDIKKDFSNAYTGILQLPIGCRLGVYTCYLYYSRLLKKIERIAAFEILNTRIRIPNHSKIGLLVEGYVKEKWM